MPSQFRMYAKVYMDKQERNEIIIKNLDQVKILAKQFKSQYPVIDYQEVICIGNLALVRAAVLYDYNKGRSFWAYARRIIINDVLKAIKKALPYGRAL